MISKISKKDIKHTAHIIAECFEDYPTYKFYFPDDTKRKKQIYYINWYRIYIMQKYTYAINTTDAFISLKTPNDKNRCVLGLLLNPFFLFGFIKNIPLSSFIKLQKYAAFEKKISRKHMNPKKDNYIHAACVSESKRGTAFFFKYFEEFISDKSFYAETHTEKNWRLYKMLGAELIEKSEWNGITHYFFKFLPENDVRTRRRNRRSSKNSNH